MFPNNGEGHRLMLDTMVRRQHSYFVRKIRSFVTKSLLGDYTQSSVMGRNMPHMKKLERFTIFCSLTPRDSSYFNTVTFVERQILSIRLSTTKIDTIILSIFLSSWGFFQESTFYHEVSVTFGSLQKFRNIDNAFKGGTSNNKAIPRSQHFHFCHFGLQYFRPYWSLYIFWTTFGYYWPLYFWVAYFDHYWPPYSFVSTLAIIFLRIFGGHILAIIWP